MDRMAPAVWFITGASAGIGRALAEAVLADGDRVVATVRNPAALDDLAGPRRDSVIRLRLDVTDPAPPGSRLVRFCRTPRLPSGRVALQPP